MLSEKIKTLRKQQGLSQDELALELHVVRQTVSKWENGLSVPDASMLIEIAKVLNVSVSDLLEIDENETNIAKELERVNYLLASKIEKERLIEKENRVREFILFLTFVSLLIMLFFNHSMISLWLIGGCVILTLIILYRNIDVLIIENEIENRNKYFKICLIFSVSVVILNMLIVEDILVIYENQEQYFSRLLVVLMIIFFGLISSKLPYNSYAGLRFPWILKDEETWRLAHRVVEMISLPLALLFIAGTMTGIDSKVLMLVTMLLWFGIPALISYVYYRTKECDDWFKKVSK